MRILTFVLIFICGVASAADTVVAYTSDENVLPTRLQHTYNYKITESFNISGTNNFDLSSDNNLDRTQIKPRLKYSVADFDGLKINLVDQFEYFNYYFDVRTPKKVIEKQVEFHSNRFGAGLAYKNSFMSTEVNYYVTDSYTQNDRFDTYLTLFYGKLFYNNQYWYVPETKDRFQQATVGYKVTDSVSLVVQQQYQNNKDSITRFGVSILF